MFLYETAVFLAAAVVAVPIFHRLGLGTVLGYLAAGVIIGPSVLGIIRGVDDVLHFAEFGVVLLLFLIGLELQPSRLWQMRREVFGYGGAQVGVTTAVLTPLGLVAGLPFEAAVLIAFGLSLSSTAFVLQLLGERNELASLHARGAFGILLFQDLAAMPVLAVIPLLGATPSANDVVESPLARILLPFAVIFGIVFAARYLLRPVFRLVAQTRNRELSAAWALLVVIATALAMQAVGLSMALGAFIAGVLLADSEYRHEAEANVEPFKGLLLGLFFMAVGMSADLATVLAHPGEVFGIAVGIVLVKLAVLVAFARIWGLPASAGVPLAVMVSQGGEFAFVLFGAADQEGLVSRSLAEILIVAVALSMATTPLLLVGWDAWRRRQRAEAAPFDPIEPAEGSVIIAGFGRFGQIVSRLLRLRRIPVTALELDPLEVDLARRFGHEIYYGDAARIDLLRAAGAARARLFVLAIDDQEASLRTARMVRESFPELRILARARNRSHAHALMAMGIEDVFRETYGSSLEAGGRALEHLGLSTAQAAAAVDRFRCYDEDLLARQVDIRDDEERLIHQSRDFNRELEQIFEADQRVGE